MNIKNSTVYQLSNLVLRSLKKSLRGEENYLQWSSKTENHPYNWGNGNIDKFSSSLNLIEMSLLLYCHPTIQQSLLNMVA